MSGRRSRRKGARWEREVARRLQALGFDEARRGLTQSRGAEQADVEGTPWWGECKCGRQPNPRAAMRQALEDTDGRPVLVVIHDDSPGGGQPAREWVAMPWDVFEAMMEERR